VKSGFSLLFPFLSGIIFFSIGKYRWSTIAERNNKKAGQ
jgi:hypothetical protein